MGEVSIVGLDLAKHVFQVHGAGADGSVAFRRKLLRAKILSFFAAQPRCLVAMEACASSHYWAREIGALGHEVKLIAPAYVKPFVKRQKNGCGRRGSDRQGGIAPDNALRGGEERREAELGHDVQDPRSLGSTEDAGHQCGARSSRRARGDCAAGRSAPWQARGDGGGERRTPPEVVELCGSCWSISPPWTGRSSSWTEKSAIVRARMTRHAA